MSSVRNTRQYSDINLLFTTNPSTADLIKKTDEEAIKASVRNLISTKNYERPFHPEIGCQVYSLLFENLTPVTIQAMKRTILQTIEKFEPRVVVNTINIGEDADGNSLVVDVYFRIINSEKPVVITTSLNRIR